MYPSPSPTGGNGIGHVKPSPIRTAQRTAHPTPRTPHHWTSAPNPVFTREPIELAKGEVGEVGEVEDSRETPYFLRGMVRADADARRALDIAPEDYGRRWQATWRRITGMAPACGPGDRGAARRYLAGVEAALDMASEEWTPSEQSHLYRIRRVWRRRAEGRDARFEVVGTRHGRVSGEEKKMIERLKFMLDLGGVSGE